MINQPLINWSIVNDISTDVQFGFKPDHSTVDAIFVLQNIIEMYLTKGKCICAKGKDCIALSLILKGHLILFIDTIVVQVN